MRAELLRTIVRNRRTNTSQFLLLWSVTLLAMTGLTTVRGAQPGDVTIQYVHPENFTDFSIYGRDYRWSASYFAKEISSDLKPKLNRKFPGSQLTLRFTDIDLAGRYRTTRRGGQDVRVTRGERTAARMSFNFLLQDSTGRTLANGSTRITDTSQHSFPRQPSGSGPLYYEKRMLEKWLNSIRVS
jgi:Protein of unknown function (DUF3016)